MAAAQPHQLAVLVVAVRIQILQVLQEHLDKEIQVELVHQVLQIMVLVAVVVLMQLPELDQMERLPLGGMAEQEHRHQLRVLL